MAGFARATASASPSPAAALLTGERLVVFLFAARVALAAPAHLAAPLAILVAAALAVELAVDGSAPLRRFRTRYGRAGCAPRPSPLPLSFVLSVSLIAVQLGRESPGFGFVGIPGRRIALAPRCKLK